MKMENGFSLVEAIAALLVGSIILSIALPAFSSLLEKNRQTQTANQLTGALHYARKTAVLRRATVTLCPGKDSCLESHYWQGHVLLFIDHNQNGQLDPDDEILRQLTLAKDISWRWSNFRQRNYFQYAGNGRTRALNGTFSLCRDKLSTRQIVINITGRTRTQTLKNPTQCH